jgi:hypothetical protein
MAAIRLFLLLLVFGGLALVLVQNWTPTLPLVFLGMKTAAQPLAIWILFSVSAGVGTSLLIGSLFQVSKYFAAPQHQPRQRPKVSRPRYTTSRSEEPTYRNSTPEPTVSSTTAQSSTQASTNEDEDDWDSSKNNDDWGFEEPQAEPADTKPKAPKSEEPITDSRSYERSQEPKSTYKSGSVYSYSYKEPKNSGVGKTESVYDADYRVITPPYRPQNQTQNQKNNPPQNDDDDWGFLDEDDDEFFDDDERPRK